MPPRAKARATTISAASKAAIRASHESGHAPNKFATSEGQYLDVECSKLTLVLPDARTTLFGAYYYRGVLEMDPPELYQYGAQLINDKWITGFSAKKILVRRRGAMVSGSQQNEENNSSNTLAMNML